MGVVAIVFEDFFFFFWVMEFNFGMGIDYISGGWF